MKKRSILILVILLAIGFAGVSTTLVLSGIVGIASDQDDFNIIFTNALLNDVERKDFIDPETKKTITFETNKLTKVNEEAVLDYEVTNTSKLYDGDVKIVCNLIDKNDNVIEDYEYIGIEYEPKSMTVEAGKKETGSITARLKKEATEDGSVKLKCRLDAEAKERDDLPTTTKITTTLKVEDLEVGDGVCFGTECFYIIEINGTKVKLFAKYNLEVGDVCDGTSYSVASSSCTPIENPSGIQNKDMIGFVDYQMPRKGTMAFSENINWLPSHYACNEETYLYVPVENYVKYLNDNYDINATGKLIDIKELRNLGCDEMIKKTCLTSSYPWVYSTSYWTGESGSGSKYVNLMSVKSNGAYGLSTFETQGAYGVRPVIEIEISKLKNASKDISQSEMS